MFRSSPAAVLLLICALTAQAEDRVDFNYDVRPIISANCYHCHGPDEATREAKLRLDVREDALKERDGTRAIAPGTPDESELMIRVRSTDPDEVMPPPKEGHSLSAAEIALLERWIAQGAEYKEHWSFVKPVRRAPPQDGAGHPIDAFIVARLEKAGLSRSPEADRHTLIRRVSLDLIGLPPTPEETRAFVADPDPQAYEKLVDRLLASPAYGERWAKMWLDLARYADSTGYGSDKFRLNIWPYRDWLIHALNENLLYDRFTIEQLAGDLLPDAARDQIAATAFHRNTMTNIEGGTIDEEHRVAAVKDRIGTTSQVWLGLTMQCAQCHTHKFDPISHKEYYQFFALFNQTEDSDREDEAPTMPLPTADEEARRTQLEAAIETLEVKLTERTPALEEEQHEWEAQMLQRIDWKALEPLELAAEKGAKLSLQDDGSIRAEGGEAKDAYIVKARATAKGITAFRLEALADPALPENGPGRSGGNAVLNEFTVTAAPAEVKPLRASIVRIEHPGDGKHLALAEVEVLSGGENIARRGKAAQSSVDYDGPPELAIDSNTDGDYFRSKSVTHTATEKDPWWEVALSEDAAIDEVRIWNRTDGGHGTRLAGARVLILDSERNVVREFSVRKNPPATLVFGPGGEAQKLKLRNASATFSQQDFPIEKAIDGDAKNNSGWAFAPQLGRTQTAIFELEKPLDGGALLTFRLEQNYGTNHTLGRFRISATTAEPPVRALPESIRAILALEPSEREPEQREELAAYFVPLSKTFAATHREIAAKQKELAAIKPVALPILRELAADKRRETRVMNKGSYLELGEPVEPGLPEAFASFVSEQAQSRLDAARWIVNPENPLTARVAVNRYWSQLFGKGIVETEEDFGTQGALPTHPELLDWLAVTFQAPKTGGPLSSEPGLGWDVKALLRLMVTSATYRQSSRVTPELLEKDPRNQLLSRQSRRRLEAEGVRDQALALSGLLSRKIGGPSVYPPQPPGLWNVAFNGGQNAYPTSKGEDRYRRGLYTFWRRTMPPPSMTTFDAPSRESCTIRRTPTNTPLQAFVTMNDPVFVECAQALGRRIVKEGGDELDERLRFGLELCLGRPADEQHVAALRALFEAELAHFVADADAAKKLATEPLGPLPDSADAAEMAAWTVVANVLLNLDGVLTKS